MGQFTLYNIAFKLLLLVVSVQNAELPTTQISKIHCKVTLR